MKKVLVLLLTVLLITFLSLSASAATLNLINNDKHPENNLINPIANVLEVSGDATTVISDTENLGVALIDATEISDFTAFLKHCKSEGVVPTFYIDSKEEADKIVAAMGSKESRVKDVTAVSSDASLLAYIHEKSVFVRTGLVYDLTKDILTSKEAHDIRVAVRSAPATFCIIESENASKQAVSELQQLAVAVWVRISSQPNTTEFDVEVIKAITSGANGIISKDVNAVTSAINTYLAKNSMTRTPVMIGHRGNPSQAPENSLAGFITAYENGADIFEIDVEITADQEIIILHDNKLNRTTNYTGTKTVGQMRLSEIKEYYLKDKNGNITEEKVPTLKEVLEAFKDKDCRIFVEFKGSNVQNVVKTAEIVKEYDMEDRIDVISFSTKFLEQTHTSMPGMSTGALVSYDFKSESYEEAIASLYRPISEVQNTESTINMGATTYSRFFQQAAVDRGTTVWPWTYTQNSNDAPFMAGCDGLTTDDVQWVKDMAKYIRFDAENLSVSLNNVSEANISYVTYGGETTKISADELIVTIVDGKDCLTVENGLLKGVAEGTAQVIFGYPTKTASGSEYVLYTQPLTVTVGESDGDNGSDKFPIIPVSVGVGVAIVAIVVLVVLLRLLLRKKK